MFLAGRLHINSCAPAKIFNTTSMSRHRPGMAVNVLPVHSKWPNFGDQITLREWEQIMAAVAVDGVPRASALVGMHFPRKSIKRN